MIATEALPAANALAVQLTTESLMFAALGLNVSLSARTATDKRFVVSPRVLAFLIAGVLTAVGVGAASTGIQILHADGLDSYTEWVRAGAIGAGIVGQPVIAFIVAFTVE